MAKIMVSNMNRRLLDGMEYVNRNGESETEKLPSRKRELKKEEKRKKFELSYGNSSIIYIKLASVLSDTWNTGCRESSWP